MTDLEPIEARLKAIHASQRRPWEARWFDRSPGLAGWDICHADAERDDLHRRGAKGSNIIATVQGDVPGGGTYYGPMAQHVAAFIAHAPADMLTLVDELKRLREESRVLRNAEADLTAACEVYQRRLAEVAALAGKQP